MKTFSFNNEEDIDSEFILFNINSNKDKIEECLNIVREYIIEHELMVVGGMSIDFGLKEMGDRLYSEYSIPDYDVISPNNIEHANNISKIICSKGYQNIAIVPAVHKTTMRVQLLGNTVFDSTFMPKYIYDKIPFKIHNGIKFIDPVYQKIDQFSSLSLLWNITGPSFNIINRLSKDIKRKDMLNKYYKYIYKNDSREEFEKKEIIIDISEIINNDDESILINKDSLIYSKEKLNSFNIDKSYYTVEPNILLHGKSAYSVILSEFKKICKKWKVEYDTANIINLEMINKPKENIMGVQFIGKSVEFVSSGGYIKNSFKIFEENSKNGNFSLKKISHQHTAFPAHYKYEDKNTGTQILVIDMTGLNLAVNHVKIKDKLVFLANYNYILSYFLFRYFMEEDESEKNIYGKYYSSLLYMVETVQNCQEYMEYIINSKEDSLFLYSVNNLHNNYWMDENYNFFIQNYRNLLNEGKNLSVIPPKNYISYPSCEINKVFSEEDRKNSHFYEDEKKEINDTNYMEKLLNSLSF